MNRLPFYALLVLSLTACTMPSGSQRPDFSGRYLFDSVNSKIEANSISSLQSATVAIEHHEPVFKFQRTFTIGGRDQSFSYDLTTDGKEVKTQSAGGQDQYSRLYWEGDALVFAMRIVSAAGESTDMVQYRLTEGGRQLEAEESFRSPGVNYDNHWVFTRQ